MRDFVHGFPCWRESFPALAGQRFLMNICLNARDAMPDGGLLKIEIEMIALDDSPIVDAARLPGFGSGGPQALRLAELERPDLAVLDVVMPHMGGAATATQLRQKPGLSILFTSGFSENATTPWPRCPDPTISRSRMAPRRWPAQFGRFWRADGSH